MVSVSSLVYVTSSTAGLFPSPSEGSWIVARTSATLTWTASDRIKAIPARFSAEVIALAQ